MKLTELYGSIISRGPIPYDQVRGGQRIAAILPSDELDVMKIERLGNVTLDRLVRIDELIKSEMIAVAAVCPGQASMRLRSDGTLSLNELAEVVWGLTPTGDYITKNPFNLDYPGCTPEDVIMELGVLGYYKKAHWIILRQYPIVGITKTEMGILQANIEKQHPELQK